MGAVHAVAIQRPGDSTPAAPYVRSVLHRDEDHEIMLARWPLHGHCAPHDHGGATGIVIVLDGLFREICWAWEHGTLREAQSRLLRPGDEIRVYPGLIHSMQALVAGSTLHVYAPSVTGMQVFDAHAQQTLVVADECGAWIPSDAWLVHSRTSWTPNASHP